MTIPPAGFEAPEHLWWLLLIPLVVVGYLLANRMKNRRGMRYTNTSMLESVIGRQSQWRRHLAVALSLLSLVTLTLAYARPFGLTEQPLPSSTIVLVLDVSLSMEATDVEPTRLEASKQAAEQFVTGLREGYNVAVVSLSGAPAVIVTPTENRQGAIRAIRGLQPQESTAIGEGIVTGLRALQSAPTDEDGELPPGAIVVLSDGESTSGRPPLQGAREAEAAEVPVYTIAYGTENGFVDLDGVREPVPPDPETMAAVAEITGGAAFEADSADELDEVYDEVAQATGTIDVEEQVTAQYAGLGLVFALLAALGAISLAMRWP